MIDTEEIKQEIDRLEHSDTTYNNCERLNILYGVLDHIDTGSTQEVKTRRRALYSHGPAPSEFAAAAKAVSVDTLIEVMDRHMDGIKVLYPKEYSLVLSRLANE